METRKVMLWVALAGVAVIYLRSHWSKFSFHSGISGVLMLLLLIAVGLAIVQVIRE